LTISLIIPALNEELGIEKTLAALAAEKPLEILVADGGSHDRTAEIAARYARVIPTPRGRAIQMNHAAREARGEILLFLHADVRLAPGALQAVANAMRDPRVAGGHFDIHYEGGDWVASAFTWINRLRYRFRIFYGDAGIFCRRSVFTRQGGYPEWPIMEDYHFARALYGYGKVASLPHAIHVSARRWRKGGFFATIWAWFWIQALFLAGVSPRRLARLYRDVR